MRVSYVGVGYCCIACVELYCVYVCESYGLSFARAIALSLSLRERERAIALVLSYVRVTKLKLL